MINEAGVEFQAGNSDRSLSLLRRAAEQNPVAVEPWLRIAQVQFAAEEYGEAIVAAEEVLRRDPTNRKGNGIITVSGLRVAADAVLALRQSENLEGSVRSEAESLAQKLRSALGETALVPVPEAQPSARPAPVAKPKPRPRARKPAPEPAPKSKPAPKPAPPAQDDDSNPFNPFETLQTLPE